MEKPSETPVTKPESVAPSGSNGLQPAPELYDEDGPIPTFPPLALDEHGRLIPLSAEERAARHRAAIRALAALDKLPDDDPPDVMIEMMRGIDARRPPGQELFEGMY
jgi:hypothetical protein